jgi:hypothetical protein
MLATRFANGSPERRWADGSTSLPPFSVKTVPDGGSLYVGVRRIRTLYTSAFRCHRGGFWCTLSTACIVAVDRFVSDNPSYIRHYRRTRVADESFMNTILLNDESFDISRDDMRYIPFPPEGAAHPQILTLGDLGPMLRSGKHFARKFDADVDGAVLDAIDERVHGRPVRSRA